MIHAISTLSGGVKKRMVIFKEFIIHIRIWYTGKGSLNELYPRLLPNALSTELRESSRFDYVTFQNSIQFLRSDLCLFFDLAKD